MKKLKRNVRKEDYIKAKTLDLRDFGYYDLTEKTVGEQFDKIVKGENLSVIGMFMQDDFTGEVNNDNG